MTTYLEPIIKNSKIPKKLQDSVHQAIEELVKNQHSQIMQGVHETNLSHHLACNLKRIIETDYYEVDIEYNRYGINKKYIYDPVRERETSIKPDIVMHKSGSQSRNRLIIEMKTNWAGSVNAKDEKKLIAATWWDSDFSYDYGLFLAFEKISLGVRAQLFWYSNGVRL